MTSDYSDDGFVQDYDLYRRQDLYIYCRACRSTFPVTFQPKTRKTKLRCMCGHEAPLKALDVFRTQAEVDAHAALYEKVYRAAKTALRDAGLQLPPSGKYRKVEQVARDPEFTSFYSEEEDASAIADGYFEGSDSDISAGSLQAGLSVFEDRLDEADDAFERHEILSDLIEWAYCRRHFGDSIRRAFREACREDIELAPQVIREAKRRIKGGEKVRVSFTSFKHLAIDHEEEAELEEALDVVEAAAALGLKGYADRARELRERIERDLG